MKMFVVSLERELFNSQWAVDREHAMHLKDVPFIPQKMSRSSTYAFTFIQCKAIIKYITFNKNHISF